MALFNRAIIESTQISGLKPESANESPDQMLLRAVDNAVKKGDYVTAYSALEVYRLAFCFDTQHPPSAKTPATIE